MYLTGFKCSEGMDQYPNNMFSCQWLFMRGKRSSFSSDVNQGPVIVTGQYRDIDLLAWFSENPILNRLVDKLVREGDEFWTDLNRDPMHVQKMKMVRQLCMDWFRRIPPFNENQSVEEINLLNHPYNPIRSALKALAE